MNVVSKHTLHLLFEQRGGCAPNKTEKVQSVGNYSQVRGHLKVAKLEIHTKGRERKENIAFCDSLLAVAGGAKLLINAMLSPVKLKLHAYTGSHCFFRNKS